MKKGRSFRIYKKSFKRVSYNLVRGKNKRKEKRAKKLNKKYYNYSYGLDLFPRNKNDLSKKKNDKRTSSDTKNYKIYN